MNKKRVLKSEKIKLIIYFMEKYQQLIPLLQEPEESISLSIIQKICEQIKDILIQQSNILQLNGQFIVVGDIHGQYLDLLEIFKKCGRVPGSRYLFLGDYVDRGYNSVGTILHLYMLKIMFPDQIYLLRGNHQSKETTRTYGFQTQISFRFNSSLVWDLLTDTFLYLPILAIISFENGKRFMCVHGGLSGSIKSLDQINQIDRVTQANDNSPFADLLWSDPSPDAVGRVCENGRGCGKMFGKDIFESFCKANQIDILIRSHQLAMQGYFQLFDGKLITIWSAPNYLGRQKNQAAVVKINYDSSHEYIFFEESKRSLKIYNKSNEFQRKANMEFFQDYPKKQVDLESNEFQTWKKQKKKQNQIVRSKQQKDIMSFQKDENGFEQRLSQSDQNFDFLEEVQRENNADDFDFYGDGYDDGTMGSGFVTPQARQNDENIKF